MTRESLDDVDCWAVVNCLTRRSASTLTTMQLGRHHKNVYSSTPWLMFYDLNIPWRTPDDELRRTVAFLDHRTSSSLSTLKPSRILCNSIQCHAHWQTASSHCISNDGDTTLTIDKSYSFKPFPRLSPNPLSVTHNSDYWRPSDTKRKHHIRNQKLRLNSRPTSEWKGLTMARWKQ